MNDVIERTTSEVYTEDQLELLRKAPLFTSDLKWKACLFRVSGRRSLPS
jgi:hypothetical protein